MKLEILSIGGINKRRRKIYYIELLTQIVICISPIILFIILYFNFIYIRCSNSLRYTYPINFDALPTADTYLLGNYIRDVIMYPGDGVLTFLAVIPYFYHYVFPLMFIICLVYQQRNYDALKFGFTVGISSMIIITFQLLLPTAPPWIYPLDLNISIIDNLQCQGLSGTYEPGINFEYYKRFAFKI
uniref:Inositol phosphorylceramide synthase (Trinotate prediction) n=1 Tax=Henneguya salminicola TaxID=69463 RepID=A0A6G3MJ38_HENSL